MARLTKRYIDALKPVRKDIIIWDHELIGFGVRISPHSQRKTFVVQYRQIGRTRRFGLGVYGKVTPDQARASAKRILGSIAHGDNPAQLRHEYRKSPTIAEVCQRFKDEHIAIRLKPSTAKEYTRAIDLFILPAFGSHKIVDISRADISALHYQFKHIPYQANRTLGVLSKMFTLSEVWELRRDGSNPCRHVPKYPETRRERFLSKEEIATLWRVLDESVANGSETIHVASAFKLLLLTGARRGEIQTLKWAYVTATALALPDSKTGPKRIQLSPDAKGILDELPQIDGNPHVIVGATEDGHITDLERPWRRIRDIAGLADVRIHDLRHTFASHAVMNGVPLPIVGKLCGHTQIQTTMRYAHLAEEEVQEAAGTIAGALMGFATAQPRPNAPHLKLVT